MKALREDFFDNIGISEESKVRDWLNANYIKNYELIYNDDILEIDVNGKVDLCDYEGYELPEYIQFGEVTGNFECCWAKLKTFRGFPRKCKTLNATACINLQSLEYCPECEQLYVNNCLCLFSLEGCPENVNWFECKGCSNLRNLKGAPKKCSIFDCSECTKITTLEGLPKELDVLKCSDCHFLSKLKGCPKTVNTKFICSNCRNLTSLKYGPTSKVSTEYNCANCWSLRNLEGAPEEVGTFNCVHCEELTSLKGAPKKVNNFQCSKPWKKSDVHAVCYANFIYIR